MSSKLQQNSDFTPPGKLYKTIAAGGETYEIWKGSLADSTVKQMVSRIQIFVPLFIEGGSYIGSDPGENDAAADDSDADRWTVFFLYQKKQDNPQMPYSFIGYSTVYRFFHFCQPTPPASPSADWELPKGNFDLGGLPCRSRLSQFIILPPFQSKGHGGRFYDCIYQHYLKEHPQTIELTVEDPNEAFDDLRDLCDLAYLQTVPEFSQIKINMAIQTSTTGRAPDNIAGEPEELETVRKAAKIAPRQFYRVLEMYLMSKLPQSVQPNMSTTSSDNRASPEDKHAYKLWRLIVKRRLYRHNIDVLGQLEPDERVHNLNETLTGVELEYARILAASVRRAQKGASSAPAKSKRRLEEDETEEGGPKRMRIDAAE